MEEIKKMATTEYISGQKLYCLPVKICPKIMVEIFNEHNKKWRKSNFQIVLQINENKKKTDKTIRIIY